MYYVYVIANQKQVYVGYTNDLRRRFSEHNSKENEGWTKRDDAWKLVYYEAYNAKQDAQERERKLKQRGRAKTLLKARISRSLNEVRKVLDDGTLGISGG